MVVSTDDTVFRVELSEKEYFFPFIKMIQNYNAL